MSLPPSSSSSSVPNNVSAEAVQERFAYFQKLVASLQKWIQEEDAKLDQEQDVTIKKWYAEGQKLVAEVQGLKMGQKEYVEYIEKMKRGAEIDELDNVGINKLGADLQKRIAEIQDLKAAQKELVDHKEKVKWDAEIQVFKVKLAEYMEKQKATQKELAECEKYAKEAQEEFAEYLRKVQLWYAEYGSKFQV